MRATYIHRGVLVSLALVMVQALVACGGAATTSPASSSLAPAPVSSVASPVVSAAASPESTQAAAPAAAGKPASSPAGAAAKPSASGAKRLTVAYGTTVASMSPLWMADAIGAFEKNGVSVTMRLIDTSASVPALISKEVDAVQVSGSPLLTAGVAGADVVFVASLSHHSVSSLYTPSSIASAADLRGKTLATDRPGTPNDYTMKKSLSLLGLKPTDVQLETVGSAEVAWAAIKSGQVKGAMLSPPLSFQADATGYRLLQDTFSIAYQNTGIMVLKSRLNELGPAIPGLLTAYREGIDAYNNQPDLAKKILVQYTKESDPTLLNQTYDFYRNKAPFDPSLQPTIEGMQDMLDFLAATLPAAKTAKPQQFLDTSYLDQLPKVPSR